VNLLELIDAYALANANARTAENLGDSLQAEHETQELRAEIERRLALAEADHPIMWRSHLDNSDSSQRRQRSLIEVAEKDRARGWTPSHAVKHARDWSVTS
jgi:hypothetical protein